MRTAKRQAGRGRAGGLIVGLVAVAAIVLVVWWTQNGASEDDAEVVAFDCVAALAYAEKWSETTAIDFGTEGDRDHYQGDDGISLIDSEALTYDGQTKTFRIAYGLTRLKLYFHEIQEREATLLVSPLSWKGGPTPTARVRLNGQDVATLELEINPMLRPAQERRFVLPASAQTVGINRLEIDWGITRKVSEVLPTQTSIDLVASAWLVDLTLQATDVEQAPPSWLGSVGVEADSQRGLHMEPGVTVTYFLEVPSDATWIFQPQVSGELAADFRVAIREHGGDETIERFRGEPGEKASRRIDLRPWAGRIVQISLSVLPTEGSVLGMTRALGSAWGRPRVVAPRVEPKTDQTVEPPTWDLNGHPVVMILCDAMRWDALSATGAPEGLTPHLDALAEESIVFEQATSQASYTVTSIPSLFSGLYPQAHGILVGADTAGKDHKKLAEGTNTLASGFRAKGYSTGAMVSNLNAGSRYGNDIGFDTFRELGEPPDREAFFDHDLGYFPSEKITSAAIDWLDTTTPVNSKFFLYVHYFEPHAPYWPAEEFLEGVVGEYAGPYPDRRDLHSMNLEMRAEGSKFGPDDLRRLRELYQATTRSVDASIGRLLDDLKRRGVYDDALIVVVSDHGEEFAEHGLLGHGEQTHDEGVRVPLMIKLPKAIEAPGGRRAGQVELVDLLPTFYRLFDLGEVPAAVWGQDFSERLAYEATSGKRFTYAMALLEKSLSIRSDDWRYIEWPERHQHELFDLRSDPGAQQDVLDEHPVMGGFLRTQMKMFLDLQRAIDGSTVSGEGVSDEYLRMLEQTGYIGGAAPKRKKGK